MGMFSGTAFAQYTLNGVVFDSSRINFVEGVLVLSTSGHTAHTDSMGRYSIPVAESDSVSFIFRNKPTQKFPVKGIPDFQHFDISLRVNVKSKYSTMKEVVVHSKTYRQDSIENRQTYADIFNYRKPHFETGTSPDGVAGLDVDEIINMFRFRRNKRIKAFQERLEMQEQEKYIDYRFSRTLVKRITALDSAHLDTFMLRYRPQYRFVSNASDAVLDQYILNCWYQYQALLHKPEALTRKKAE